MPKDLTRIPRSVRILAVLLGKKKGYPLRWFCEQLELSSNDVAPYLTRLTARGFLRRSGRSARDGGRGYRYRLSATGTRRANEVLEAARSL